MNNLQSRAVVVPIPLRQHLLRHSRRRQLLRHSRRRHLLLKSPSSFFCVNLDPNFNCMVSSSGMRKYPHRQYEVGKTPV
ncbi:hypothetical protein DY000_02004909 [Brassica cretica]|uniref:Uncharacterized protein n=1 Tax=Brassica cretica TaxID=69181 RepID=A0ABQ7BSU8_BRACR|nr:hypothetical protein DY000_02004909 [Brassica cretica]